MSEIKVNKISPRSGTTVTLGDSGDTFTIPSGATISNAGTAAGFGSTGEISWDTTPKTGDFTGVSGVGYFVNTAGGEVTITLPGSPSAGNVIGVSDYNSTAATNSIVINRNSNKINGGTDNLTIGKANTAIQLVYIDATTGWQSVFTGNPSDITRQYIVATGGTITEDGNFKVHKFTGPGTFQITTEAENSPDNVVDYLVVAGGGAGGMNNTGGNSGGGGGAGGTRFTATTYCSSSPLKAPAGLPVSATSYPITVGAGGVGAAGPCSARGAPGNDAVFSTITSGGGAGGGSGVNKNGRDGGSGGGGAGVNGPGGGAAGGGNSPSVSPAQGNNGGVGNNGSDHQGGGGGGFTAVGQAGACGGDGGAGLAISITGSPVAYGGGGGGGRGAPSAAPAVPQGGLGGGGNGSDNILPGGNPSGSAGGSGTVNTGGGGGGTNLSQTGGSGGSGVVIIRYRFK